MLGPVYMEICGKASHIDHQGFDSNGLYSALSTFQCRFSKKGKGALSSSVN